MLDDEEAGKSAVFSLGLMLVDALTLDEPFSTGIASEAHYRIQNGELPSFEGSGNKQHVQYIRQMLSTDLHRRVNLFLAQSLVNGSLDFIDTDNSESSDD